MKSPDKIRYSSKISLAPHLKTTSASTTSFPNHRIQQSVSFRECKHKRVFFRFDSCRGKLNAQKGRCVGRCVEAPVICCVSSCSDVAVRFKFKVMSFVGWQIWSVLVGVMLCVDESVVVSRILSLIAFVFGGRRGLFVFYYFP